MNPKPNNTITGTTGEFYVAAELGRQGILALMTPKNNPLFDIVAVNPEATRFAFIQDLKRNSVMLQREQKGKGLTETQSFKISKSKPIIDQIDTVLAEHYGFTEAELDFIINYDIKYRMGKALFGEEENEEEEE